MNTIFTQIINRKIPAYIVAEDDNFIAFLDINPLQPGHTLVVNKKEVDYFFDIDDDDLQNYILFAKGVAGKIKKTIPCNRIGMSVVGLEIPHAHIHLIPINSIADMDFSKEPLKLSKEEMENICEKIKNS